LYNVLLGTIFNFRGMVPFIGNGSWTKTFVFSIFTIGTLDYLPSDDDTEWK
jgi:hypothetical protein